ncbi:MAG: glycosyltransferase family 4 protein [Candidatus Nealsonbacteria bacterium]
MKLLIISQKVDINDDNLGFFHYWLEKFAGKLEKVYVACLSEGKHSLPENVLVYSLGKEKGYSKLRQLFRLQKFLFKNLKEVDGVFVHMCPIYAIASFPLVKVFRKKMILWYLHKSVNWKLKLTGKLVDKILTASKESCRLKNREKIEIVGHGIDTNFFKPLTLSFKPQGLDNFRIIFVGRIAPIKDLETLIKAIDILVNQKNIRNIKVRIIGSSIGYYEKKYHEKLIELIKEKELVDYIEFLGGKPHREVLRFYQNNNVLLNLSPTGGMDKAVLEAMACSVPVLVCNIAFKKDLGDFVTKLIFQKKNPQDLAQKILNLKNIDTVGIEGYLRKQVVQNHNLDNLINKIIHVFEK